MLFSSWIDGTYSPLFRRGRFVPAFFIVAAGHFYNINT
jgi:hypothetical protein